MLPSVIGNLEERIFGRFRQSYGSLPFVSVIIPVYNDPTGVAQTLESLVNQTYPRSKHEIIVVDNGSTDNTRSVVEEYRRTWENVTLRVEAEIQSSYAARNAGIRASKGEVCTFIDADMTVDRTWLEAIAERFARTDIEYLGCRVEITVPSDGNTVFARYNKQTGFPVRRDIEQKEFAPTCCLSVHRSVFEDIGTFDSRLVSGGDLEFGNRASRSGIELHYAENLIQYHPARTSFRSLAKKSLRQGRGVGQLQRYYPERYGSPGIPPRPSGSFVDEETDSSIRQWEHFAFNVFVIVFTLLRGVGYYSEVLEGVFQGADEPQRMGADVRIVDERQ